MFHRNDALLWLLTIIFETLHNYLWNIAQFLFRYDQAFLSSKLGEYTTDYTGSDDFWIGLSDTDVPGTYKWVDGSYPTFSAWGPGQPGM